MRILHVNYALVGGGAETQLKMLMNGLVKNGHDVGVIFIKDDVSFKNRKGISFCIPRGKKWGFLRLYKHIGEAISVFKPDVVHAWLPEFMTIPTTLYCKIHSIPCVSAQRRAYGMLLA